MNDIVKIENDQVITTSYQIAKVFGKRHSNVLQDIKSLLGQVDDDFAKRNFEFFLNIDKLKNDKLQPYYTLTKDRGAFYLPCGFGTNCPPCVDNQP